MDLTFKLMLIKSKDTDNSNCTEMYGMCPEIYMIFVDFKEEIV